MPKLTPVDGDPFAQKEQKLTPVSHDPFKMTPVEGNPFADAQPAEEPGLLSGAANYVKGSVESAKLGARQLAEGIKETVTGFPERYAAAQPPEPLESAPFGRVITGPAYRAGAALLGSPASEAINEVALGTMGMHIPSIPSRPGRIKPRARPEAAAAEAPPLESPAGGQVTPPELPPYQAPPENLPAAAAGPATAEWSAYEKKYAADPDMQVSPKEAARIKRIQAEVDAINRGEKKSILDSNAFSAAREKMTAEGKGLAIGPEEPAALPAISEKEWRYPGDETAAKRLGLPMPDWARTQGKFGDAVTKETEGAWSDRLEQLWSNAARGRFDDDYDAIWREAHHYHSATPEDAAIPHPGEVPGRPPIRPLTSEERLAGKVSPHSEEEHIQEVMKRWPNQDRKWAEQIVAGPTHRQTFGMPPIERPNAGGAVQGAKPVAEMQPRPRPGVQTPGTPGALGAEGKPVTPGPKPAPSSLGAATPLYPELHALGLEPGKALLQQRLGLADREATQAITRLEPYQAQVNALPRQERYNAMAYMENRSKGAKLKDPALQPAADELRRVYKDIEYKWEALKPDMKFIEDYLRREAKQPEKVRSFLSAWKEGSTRGAGQKRTFPTISEFMQAGHELKNDNFIEVGMDYAAHMSRYLGAEEAFQMARAHEAVKYYDPRKAPEGWVPLEGRHSQPNRYGQVPHAPEEFATPWNRFAGEGFTGVTGDVLQGTRQVMNTMTALKLMSGYHVMTIAAASFTSELSRAFTSLAAGRSIRAGKSLASSMTILAPILGDAALGWRGQRIYSGEGMQGAPKRAAVSRFLARELPEEQKIIDFQAMSNMRPNKMDKSMSMTMQGNLYTAWKRGALSGQLSQYKSNIADAPGMMKSIPITQAVMSLTGRTLQTIMAPLFEKFIPMVKLGRAMRVMGDYLHDNPTASFEDIMQQARTVQRNMDDRFGEMIQDNLFWNQKLKESLQVAMLSYSWNVGIGRALGGGAKDLGMMAAGKGKFTDRAAYAIAFPLGAMYLGAVYQGLKGQGAPEDFVDLLGPLTGGVNAGDKYHQETPERALIPGHAKDVFEVYQVATGDKSILDIGISKLNPALKLLGDLATGKDWKGDPISDANAAVGQRIMQNLEFAGKEILPIPVGGIMHQPEGSGFNMFETVMGVRRAPSFLQDPTGHGETMRSIANKEWVDKRRHDMNQAKREGDFERAAILQQEIRQRSSRHPWAHKMRVQ